MNVRYALIATLAAAGPLMGQAPTRPAALRAATVLRTIETDGASRAIARYFADDSTFGDAVLSGVATGTADWLRVAALLRPSADAGVSEFLEIAVADALPRAPSRVLAMLGPDFPVERICGIPFIEQPDAEEAAYYRRAAAALARVARPGLRHRRDQCRAALRRAHAAAPAA